MSEVAGDTGAIDPQLFTELLEDNEQEYGGAGDLDEEAILAEVEYDEDEDDDAEDSREDSGREGTVDVIARLRETDPGAANVLDALNRERDRERNETLDLQRDILAVRQEMLDMREENAAAPSGSGEERSGEAAPPGTEAQHEYFQRMIEYYDLIPRSELATREEEAEVSSQAQSYTKASLEAAFEEYGANFGVKHADGSITIHPEVQETLRQTMAVVTDPAKGITPLDLFRLSPKLAGNGRGRKKGSSNNGLSKSGKVARSKTPSNVVRRTSGGRSAPKIYDSKRGDKPDDVFARSWVLGKTDLTN